MTATKKPYPMGEFEDFCASLPANQLGNLLAAYINESNHSNWEGFASRDKTGIGRLLNDIMTYHKNSPEVNYNHPGYSGTRYFTKVT